MIRIKLVLAVAALLVAMLAVIPGPAAVADVQRCNVSNNNDIARCGGDRFVNTDLDNGFFNDQADNFFLLDNCDLIAGIPFCGFPFGNNFNDVNDFNGFDGVSGGGQFVG